MSVDLPIPDDVHAQLQTALALIAHHEKELARRDAQIAEMASIGAVIAKEDRQRMAKDIGVAQGRTGEVPLFSG